MQSGEENYRRFLSGDKEGLSELVRQYRDGLLLYINSIVGNTDTAEELMEDTFVKLYVKKPRFSGKSTFKTWLYSIARFTAVDYLRKSSRLREVSLHEAFQTVSAEDAERELIKDEDKIALHKALSRLKPEYSQILYLIYFEDFTGAEAAVIMKKTSKQIRDLLYNAKKALRKELEKEGFSYEEL